MKFTPKERLYIYEKALDDWKKLSYETTRGFCKYFGTVVSYDVFFEPTLKRFFPELYNQKPAAAFRRSKESDFRAVLSVSRTPFWFEIGTEQGCYLRRICLIAAIEEVKLKIENDEKNGN